MPVELLMRIREVTGSVAPQPEDRVRDDELACAEMIAAQVKAGFRETAMLQLLRAQSDGTRRMAETESAMWQSEVIGPAHGGRQTARRDPRSRPRRSDERPHRALGHRHVPPAADARVDRQHHRRLRDDAGRRRSAQPSRAPTGDVLPRHQRLHAPHPGTRRRGRGSDGGGCSAGSSSGRRSSTAAGP